MQESSGFQPMGCDPFGDELSHRGCISDILHMGYLHFMVHNSTKITVKKQQWKFMVGGHYNMRNYITALHRKAG